MAYASVITCNTCGNLILPGDVVSVVTKGYLLSTGSEGTQVEDAISPLHFCDSCSKALGADLRGLVEETEERLAAEGPSLVCIDTGTGYCNGSCVPS